MSSSKFVKGLIGQKKQAERKDVYLTKNPDWRSHVARVMLTGIIKNQYYRNQESVVEEALKLLPQAAQEDPSFLLKTCLFARNLNMKGMVKVGLVAINGFASEEFLARETTVKYAVELLSTFHPGQLLQFVELCKSKKIGRGFGSRPQKWVRAAMESWKANKLEDYTLKYPTALNSLVRLVHPRFTDARGLLVNYVLNKNVATAGDKQKAVDILKQKKMTSSQAALWIIENQIPFDVSKGIGYELDKDLALAQMTQMGLTALLLNIRSLEQHGAFNTREGLEALSLKMGEVQEGRSIPIDFAKPYIYSSSASVKKILLDGMAATLDIPMPAIEGKSIGLSIDISGSMQGETLKTAGLLAVPFLKSKDLWLTTFDTSLYDEGTAYCPKIKGLSRANQIKNLLDMNTHGGTNISLPLERALAFNKKVDLMIIITDEQQNAGTPLMKLWKQYRAKVNSQAELWIINATNYEWSAADYNDPSVTVYQSLSPAIFKNIEFSGVDIVSTIDNFKPELKSPKPSSAEFVKNTTKKNLGNVIKVSMD